jgi:hypothetical protein
MGLSVLGDLFEDLVEPNIGLPILLTLYRGRKETLTGLENPSSIAR